MDDIVILDDGAKAKLGELQERWKAYLEAKDRAEQTRDMDDAIAAGKAWAAWVEPFTEQHA